MFIVVTFSHKSQIIIIIIITIVVVVVVLKKNQWKEIDKLINTILVIKELIKVIGTFSYTSFPRVFEDLNRDFLLSSPTPKKWRKDFFR